MTDEMFEVIAETEGIRTPKRKRTRKELTEIYTDYVEKTEAKKKAKKQHPVIDAKPSKALIDRKKAEKEQAEKAAEPKAEKKPAPKAVDPIQMCHVSPTGYVREAGFDAETKMFHVAFAKSTWAMPSTEKEWADFEKAVADPSVEIDRYYRTNFRGRTPQMSAVRRTEVTK